MHWIWPITRRCRIPFALCRNNGRPSENIGREEAQSRLTAACADMAWWYGWSVGEIDALTLEDFEAFHKEATRQMKAGYGKVF